MKRLGSCLLFAALVAGWATPPAGAVAVDDPELGRQWGLEKIGAPRAWDRGTGEGAVIAIVDSGVDLGHEDLKDRIVASVSCVGADDDPARCQGPGQDSSGHGTGVAGIAAAATNNGKGGGGTAPEAGIMVVKVLDVDPVTGDVVGRLSDVAAGIRWAVDHGAHVVNLSLSEDVAMRGLLGTRLYDAIEYAWDRGVITVVAAGNQRSFFDSGYDGVNALVVTATTVDGRRAEYATDIGGADWGIAAPGGEATGDVATEIFSTLWDPLEPNAYGYMTGTSMAAPFVSGAAAVLRALGLSPEETVDRLLSTAVDLGQGGEDAEFGYGLLNLAAATEGYGGGQVIESPPTTLPPPPPPPPLAPPAPAAVAEFRRRPPPPPLPTTAPPTAEAPFPTTTIPSPDAGVAVAREVEPERPPTGAAPWVIGGGTATVAAAMAFRTAASRRRDLRI